MFGFSSRRDYNRDKLEFENEYPLQPEPIRDADHIPLRLNPRERKIQRLMRGIILASCYTDMVDVGGLAPSKRDTLIAKELSSALMGLVVGLDVRKAASLFAERDFKPYAAEIRMAVESCRRYKIMNPDLLRTDYVKFLYMVQDAVQNEYAAEILGFSVASPLVTVGRYCDELGIRALLADERLPHCITPVPTMRNRDRLNKCLRTKDVKVDALVAEHAKRSQRKPEAVELVVRSLNDANCFSNENVKSTALLLSLLHKHFSPDRCDELTSLAIAEGTDGSRLSHDHARQYAYVHQSLMLWKNINQQMFALWTIAEEDMLNPDEKYELRQTGQGLQRVQKAPNLYKAVHRVLQETKAEMGSWVGSERIHLGDDQVPNAFHFIDKYGQISRIIVPLLRTVDYVEQFCERSPKNEAYVKEVWGSAAGAQRAILRDFFRHGFDGSGGDNMDDAGSCVDGRITSAWNWCNNIRFKPFYPLFLMAGFSSFDGDMSI